jgi:tripartite-type tricarboxylate transporter receptor subunit TctC
MSRSQTRSAIAAIALAFIGSVSFAQTATAQSASGQSDWPNRQVTVVVPFAAGGNTDVAARIFAERLGARLGKPFIIENRTGAGGSLGIAAVSKATADGYTLGTVTSGTLFILPHIYREKLGYDTLKDLKMLAMVGTQPNFMVVHPSVPAKTMPELIAHIKANPGKISYGSSGIGTSQHLCMEVLVQKTGIDVIHVPYRGSNQIMNDLIAGHIQVSCDQISSSLPQVNGGNARGIAVTSLEKYPLAMQYPAVAETIPGVDVTWAAIFIAPSGIPQPIADKLMAELGAISKEPDVQKRLADLFVTPLSIVGTELESRIRSDYDKWKPIVESAKIPQP